MRYTVTKQIIQVIGELWEPGFTAAQEYTLDGYQMENLGDPRNRDDVQSWVNKNTGDFSSVTDFCADFTIGDESVIHGWASPASEHTYADCVYPTDDEDEPTETCPECGRTDMPVGSCTSDDCPSNSDNDESEHRV